MLESLSGPLRIGFSCREFSPGNSRSLPNTEAFQGDCAIEERFRRGRRDPQRGIGRSQSIFVVLRCFIRTGDRGFRRGDIAPNRRRARAHVDAVEGFERFIWTPGEKLSDCEDVSPLRRLIRGRLTAYVASDSRKTDRTIILRRVRAPCLRPNRCPGKTAAEPCIDRARISRSSGGQPMNGVGMRLATVCLENEYHGGRRQYQRSERDARARLPVTARKSDAQVLCPRPSLDGGFPDFPAE